jgi:Domain of unknown function (DUF4402)
MRGLAKAALAFGALLASASPAMAAPVSAPTAPPGRALLLIPLTLTKVQDLSFGTVIPSTTSAGFVTINATTGARTTSPSITPVATDIGQQGQFAGAGSAGQQVVMNLTPATELSNLAGDKITVLSMALDGPTTRTISAAQTFFVGVGGVIYIEVNQPEGVYTSTYDLTADYQ